MLFKWWDTIKAKSKQDGGFTLIETMVAMMIFAVGISAALYMQTIGINTHTQTRNHVDKAHGSVMQVETLNTAVPFDDPVYMEDDGGNYTPGDGDPFDKNDMPIRNNDGEKKFDNASFTIRQDYIVQGIKMIYLSNKLKAEGKPYTLGLAKPYLGRGSQNNHTDNDD